MDPPEYLGLLLHDARVYGWSFEMAWPQAVGRAARISSTPGDWRLAFEATRAGWERAFAGMAATAPEHALREVEEISRPRAFAGMAATAPEHALREVEEISRPDSVDLKLEARRCKQCDRLLPTDQAVRAQFCEGGDCRREFNYELERRRAGHPPRPDPQPAPWVGHAARQCETCGTNWVVQPDRFCSKSCEDQHRTVAARITDQAHLTRP